MIRVREATPADISRLSAFAEAIFRETFSASNSAADMDAYCASAFGADIQAREIADVTTRTLVVDDGAGCLVAYAQLHAGTSPSSISGDRPIELKRFYVATPLQGLDVAPALMTAVVELATHAAFDVMWLGVWEHNPRAIKFYRKNGFEEVGDQVFFVGQDRQRDLVMARRLTNAAGVA